MSQLDLDSAEGRAAYRRELRGVAKEVRWAGLGLTWGGVFLMTARQYGWLHLPNWVEGVAIGLGATLVFAAIAMRTRYQRERMGR